MSNKIPDPLLKRIQELKAENADLVVALKLCKLNVIEMCQTHGYPLPEYTLELTDKALAKHRGEG